MANSGIQHQGTLSFERIAPVYDSTRRMSDEVCIEVSREVFSEAGSGEGMSVVDIGAGTGRFSVPLAVRGFRVVGVDVSKEMLRLMLSKLRREWLCRLQPVVADAQNLPFRDKCFNAALCFQVLHLIQNWHLVASEAGRVLRDGAPMAIGESIRTGVSAEVNEKYKEIRGKHGFHYRRLGVSDIEEAIKYLRGSGWTVSDPETHSWVGHVTINSIIQGLADKVYSGTWNVPDEAHHEIIEQLRDWANKRYNNLDISREVASEFRLAFARSSKT
ncbi:MAG: methyltransferase domain-containing protein [Promethearchaeati archaeon SRVP18_Atabeyarchaeia-1]